ncbi:DUF2125 domain-containing protein [Pikeienuella sp. HZG-20]|uniref:DUF2125 domain-containing protein n=1 Tax=Paludibacillus litoralis TaxID=3133267 RepID=UPI0030EDD5F8
MRPSRMIIIGAAGLAVLWTAGWFAGRSLYIEPEADKVIAQLREGRLFFTYERREVGGFPFGYDVVYEGASLADSSALWRWTAPSLTVGARIANADEVTLTPSRESKLTIETTAFSAAPDAAPLVFDVIAETPRVLLGEADGETKIKIRAGAVSATQAPGANVLSNARARLETLALDLGSAPNSGGASVLTADSLSLSYRLAPDMVSETNTKLQVADIAIDFDGEALDAATFADFVARDGAADFSVRTGRYQAKSEGSGGPSAPPYTVDFSAASSESSISVGEGRAAYAARAADIAYAMKTDEDGANGGAAAQAFTMTFDMPIRQAPEPQPYAFSLSINDLALDEAFWDANDPIGAITRTPISLDLDFAGALRILEDLGGGSLSHSPVDVETLEIRSLRAEGLGLVASASGALDIAGDAMFPDGNLTVELKGALGLLGQLTEAGLIPPEAAEIYTGAALTYGRAGEGPDHLLADIRVAKGAMTINGRPLQ